MCVSTGPFRLSVGRSPPEEAALDLEEVFLRDGFRVPEWETARGWVFPAVPARVGSCAARKEAAFVLLTAVLKHTSLSRNIR